MTEFFNNIHYKYPNVIWIAESSIWSNIHSIYHSVWAIRLWISNNQNLSSKIKNTNKWNVSDIFIHPNIAEDYSEKMNMPVKLFLKKNKDKIREVLKMVV